MVKANLIYTTDGAHPRADWLSIPAKLQPDQKIEATLPPSATHYFINLIDENNFPRKLPRRADTEQSKKWEQEEPSAALSIAPCR